MRTLLLVLALAACSDNDGPGDSGLMDATSPEPDTGLADAGPDADDESDAATDAADTDAGADSGADSGPEADAGNDAAMDDVGTDTGDPCDAIDLGERCESDDECRAPYRCDDAFGRCVPPSDRMICGGIAGAMCSTRTFPECTLVSGASGGPCLSTQESLCVCRDHSDVYACRAE